MTKTTLTPKRLIADLVTWVRSHNGEVDHGAFIDACDEVLRDVWPKGRRPFGVYGRGVITLDIACALVGCFTPAELRAYPSLPGMSAYLREATHGSDW